MDYKLQVFCPDDPLLIERIINAIDAAGGGKMGNYSHTAFILRGTGQWKSEPGAHPAIGKIGELSQVPEVKLEMRCEKSKAKAVLAAIKSVHPYEEPAIEFSNLEEV